MKYVFRVDASFCHQRCLAGIGIALRGTNHRRETAVIAIWSEAYWDVPACSMEKFAVLRALEIAAERGFSHVKVRSDYNAMRRKLRADYRSGTEGPYPDDVHTKILHAAWELECVQFAWVHRRRNQHAHKLARAARANLNVQRRPDIAWTQG